MPSPSERHALNITKYPFWAYLAHHKRRTLITLFALLITNILDVLPPFLIGQAIDQTLQKKPWIEIAQTIGLMFTAISLLAFFRYIWRIQWGGFHHRVAEDLRQRIFIKLTELTPSFYQNNPVGRLMSLVTNDVNAFRMAVGPGVLILFDAAFLLCLVPPIMWSYSPSWTWKCLLLMPLVPIFMAWVRRSLQRHFETQQSHFADLSAHAQEIVSGIRVIKSYAQEKRQTSLYNVTSHNYENSCNSVARVEAYFSPIMELGVTSGCVVLLFIGGEDVIAGTISLGSFFAFYQYIQRMVWPMTAIGIGVTFIQQGKASFKRILQLLETKPDIQDHGIQTLPNFKSLEVINLNFRFPEAEKPTLNQVSFKLQVGEVLAIVGHTGAGKSTLVDLICRQYVAPSNTVFFNGHSIESLDLETLRSLICYVPQESFLFNRNVKDNISLDSTAELSTIEKMVQKVNLEQEVLSWPEGYETILGERGVNLSGGQKQRLAIARALLRNSPLLIFDDSLSAIDTKTKSKIIQHIRNQVKNAITPSTAIFIGHTLSDLTWADKFLVLNDGAVEYFGNFEEVSQNSPSFQSLMQLQQLKGIDHE